ncbi:putative manganese-dependent inorganic diphosphatase [Roseiconus lacunae]|uniref:inorganic diphosphatase n=1 Tax=Roseiconus lacunae TaxID=2605694 RepID=A0ABT7PBQ8_9BACT|nr:putative manganese-dependent inorganic diphosphatase [Roseiconus lacunae]MCD0462111.1 putative manganese-dependent inorganic diphosphatase [Roseiconus lacunae]MDM4013932.1 putative manganese-dependent inorganic diphosphatase [Roseiconus lacunae]WRQ53228.1 putative manganese-dependent inorganic diphosphatase [Stieleria sp. HD01]
MPLFVFGHRNPDTDAICAAIAYADFLRRTTRPDAIAACCGAPNQRTEFALKKAGLSHPRIVMDVRPVIEDVCQTDVTLATCEEVFYEVYRRMDDRGLRSIPVVDRDKKLVGIVTLLDLLELVLNSNVDPTTARQVRTNLSKIVSVLGGEFQHAVEPDRDEDLIVSVGAMSAGGFTEHIKQFPAERLIVVSGDRPTIQLPALEVGVRALVVTGGYELSDGLMQLAQARGISVLRSPFDTATTTMRIKAAQLISGVVESDFMSLPARMPVADARREIFRSPQTIFPVLEDGELVGVLSKSDLVNPPKPELVLVDHNEIGQAVAGADEARIIEVLDHHRLGGSLKSTEPIRLTMEPVGSTCTLVAKMFQQAGIDPDPSIALCMASGMISDTLFLRSPTTTDTDRNMLDWLQRFCSVQLDQFANDFFKVGSALRTCSPDEVVREDCKHFEESGQKFSISQIEEIGFDLFWQRKKELFGALESMANSQQLEFSALLVTDIASNGSLLLMSREPEGWEEINYPELEDRLYQLDGVVSRKKQLLPLISSLMESH